MKKVLSILLSVAMIVLCFAACGKTDGDKSSTGKAANVKVGFIFLHDENSTYDKNFITAAEEACKKAGVEILKKTNISETQACYDAAAELVDEGCNVIFADSFGHEPYVIQAAALVLTSVRTTDPVLRVPVQSVSIALPFLTQSIAYSR